MSFISDFFVILRLGNTVWIYSLYVWFYPDPIFNISIDVLVASLRYKVINDAIDFIKELFKWRLILCLPFRYTLARTMSSAISLNYILEETKKIFHYFGKRETFVWGGTVNFLSQIIKKYFFLFHFVSYMTVISKMKQNTH